VVDMDYKTVAWGEVKANVYAGDNCEQHEPYIEMSHEADMGSSGPMDDLTFDKKRWPVGTKITIEVPSCPDCHLDAEYQGENGKCECGFDWKNWADEQYS